MSETVASLHTGALLTTILAWKFFSSGDPVVAFEPDDPRLLAAEAEAQRTFPLFVKFALADDTMQETEKGVKVKLPLPEPHGGSESVWVDNPRVLELGGYEGRLRNVPQVLTGLRKGDSVSFDTDQVVDWYFNEPSGKIRGHFVTRVMLQGERPPRGARSITDRLADETLPPNWNES